MHHAKPISAEHLKKYELAKLESLLKKYPQHIKQSTSSVEAHEMTEHEKLDYISKELQTANEYHVKILELLECTHAALEHLMTDYTLVPHELSEVHVSAEPVAEVVQINQGSYVTLTLTGAEPLEVGQKLYKESV